MVADKMVRTKWYGQNGIRTKWYWTKWYGQNGTDKSSINPTPIDNMIFFHQSRFQFDTFSFPLCTHNLFVTFGYSIYIEFNGFQMLTKYKIVPFCPYHFVHTILSNAILSVYHFVHTILSVPFCPLPFGRSPFHVLRRRKPPLFIA